MSYLTPRVDRTSGDCILKFFPTGVARGCLTLPYCVHLVMFIILLPLLVLLVLLALLLLLLVLMRLLSLLLLLFCTCSVSLNSQENKMTSRNLSIVFAPNFTQPPLDNFSTSLTSSLSQVVALMISQCHLVFGTTGSAAGRTGTGSTPTREAPSAGLSSASAASLTSDSAARGAPLPAYEVVSLSNPGSRPPSVTDSHPSIATASTSAGSSPKLPRRSPSQKSPAPSASANPPEEIEMYGRTPVWGAR